MDSTEHKQYDKRILFVESDFNKVIELEIEHDGKISTVLMVVPYYTPLTSFLAPHKCGLFMMLNDILCVFAPEDLSIIKQAQIDSIGTMFEVHPLGDDYILYGEVVIYRIDPDLNVKWEFSGRDIFVKTQGNDPAFILKDDRICLYDFEDNYYEIDLEGRPIPSTDF